MRIGLNLLAVRSQHQVGVDQFVRNVVGNLQLPDDAEITVALRRTVALENALGDDFSRHNRNIRLSRWSVGPTPMRILIEMFILPLRLFNDDIILSINNFGPVFGKRLQKRVVVVHDVWFLSDAYDGSKVLAGLFHLLLRIQQRVAQKVVTVSEFSRRALVSCMRIRGADVTVVGNCLPTSDAVNHAHSALVNADEAACGNSPYFLLIGSDRGNKNIERAVAAYAHYCGSTDEAIQLVVVGTYGDDFVGKLRQKYSEIFDKGLRIEGYVTREEFKDLLRGSTAVVFPSLYEGYGIPVAEALANGKFVLVSRGTVCEELAGEMGVVVDGHDVTSIAQGLEKLQQCASHKALPKIHRRVTDFFDCAARARTLAQTLMS